MPILIHKLERHYRLHTALLNSRMYMVKYTENTKYLYSNIIIYIVPIYVCEYNDRIKKEKEIIIYYNKL